MKRIVSIVLVLLMTLSLSACSVRGNVNISGDWDSIKDALSGNDVIYDGAQVPEDTEEVKIEMGSGDREFLVGNCHVYIHDDANLLSGLEHEKLLNVVAQYSNKISFNILFLTYDDAHGKSTETYSDDYMDTLLPYKAHDNIAFVIDMDNREYYINTMGKAIDWIDSNEIEEALGEGYDSIINGEYAKCLQKVSNYCLKELAREQSKEK